MRDILTITVNPALDLSTEAPAVVPDRKLRCSAPRLQPGGGGVNVSRAIRALGGTSRTLLAHGGHTGATYVDRLREEGLEPLSLGVTYPTRESVTVRDAANGLQYRFMMPGPPWTAADADGARDAILAAVTDGALVVPSGSFPPGLPETFFLDLNPALEAVGAHMLLDTSGAALSLAAEAGAGLHVLRMDLEEAQEMSGRALARIEDVADLAEQLRQAGAAQMVLIAAGAQGNVIASPDWRGLTRPPVVVPLSKVGAGDSFMAAFSLALARQEDPVTACAWGTAAAASAVTTPDSDLCRAADVERYFAAVTRQPL